MPGLVSTAYTLRQLVANGTKKPGFNLFLRHSLQNSRVASSALWSCASLRRGWLARHTVSPAFSFNTQSIREEDRGYPT